MANDVAAALDAVALANGRVLPLVQFDSCVGESWGGEEGRRYGTGVDYDELNVLVGLLTEATVAQSREIGGAPAW